MPSPGNPMGYMPSPVPYGMSPVAMYPAAPWNAMPVSPVPMSVPEYVKRQVRTEWFGGIPACRDFFDGSKAPYRGCWLGGWWWLCDWRLGRSSSFVDDGAASQPRQQSRCMYSAWYRGA